MRITKCDHCGKEAMSGKETKDWQHIGIRPESNEVFDLCEDCYREYYNLREQLFKEHEQKLKKYMEAYNDAHTTD